MYTRFTDTVNTLGALGKTFSNSKKVKKIIRSLLNEWRPKRTVIEEDKNLNTLPIDDLIGSLISYEEDLVAEKGNVEKKKSIALKAMLDDEEMVFWLRDSENSTRKLVSGESFETIRIKKRRMSQSLAVNARSPNRYDRNVLFSIGSRRKQW